MKKRNKTGRIRLLDFRPYHKATVIKIVLYWHTHTQKQKYRIYRIENPEIKPSTYGQLIHNKGGMNIQWRKDSLFNKWHWETGQLHVKE